MPKQLGFLIDLGKCLGCHSCELACKNQNQLAETSFRRVLDISQRNNVFSYLSLACNHCANPKCIMVCSQKCYRKLRNGIVIHQAEHCDGCQSCVGACPFSVPKYHALTKKVRKCNLCYGRVQNNLLPACVNACIAKALQVIDLSDPLPSHYHKTLPDDVMISLTSPSVRFLLPQEKKRSWLG